MANPEKIAYVHCPAIGCDEPLKGSWKDYMTEEVNMDNNMPVYKCPKCGYSFTVDDLKVNAVPVAEAGDTFIFDVKENKVTFHVPNYMKFTDGEAWYVHIPQLVASRPSSRCFNLIVDETITDEMIEEELRVYAKGRL